jgi:hypothetical protein
VYDALVEIAQHYTHLHVDVQNANLSAVVHGAHGLNARSIGVRVDVCVLHELARLNVGFDGLLGREVVVDTVHLSRSARARVVKRG